MKAELGGQATSDRGKDRGKDCSVKKLSFKISSMVALREGSFMSIFEMNRRVVSEREMESGKL